MTQFGYSSSSQLLTRAEVEQRMLALEQRLAGLALSGRDFDIQPKRNLVVLAKAKNLRASNIEMGFRRLPNNPANDTASLEENSNPGETIDTCVQRVVYLFRTCLES